MADTLIHRGPDHGGFFVDEKYGLCMSHRRLAIIDTSVAGHQPMESNSGRFVIVFNGEIYNFHDLKKTLEATGVMFKSNSDTEVFIEYISAFGVANACRAANGMFAFAIWDKRERKLTLGRDRFGQKPLYYGWLEGGLYFASELKAIRSVVSNRLERNNEAVSLYLRHSYIPAPWSIYRDVYKLEPGRIIEIDGIHPKNWKVFVYWSALNSIYHARENPFEGSIEDATDELENLANISVGECMISDVPLGALLSGGIDSSAVTALMATMSSKLVKTFSIGFDDSSFDESKHAEDVAKYLGTDHTTLRLSQNHLIEAIPKLADLYDEPFADSSQIPTYLVSRLAANHVTVALTGDGGDEVFGGYTRYAVGNILDRAMTAPHLLRKAASLSLSAPPQSFWNASSKLFGNPLRMAGDKVAKLARILKRDDFAEAYVSLTSSWEDPSSILECPQHPNFQMQIFRELDNLTTIHRMMATDTLTYLTDDILAKVDRASMAVSLETRIPLLDHRLFEFSWRLPVEFHSDKNIGKRVLRSLVNRRLPSKIMDRPKMGFAIPLAHWLRTQLQDWAEDLLDPKELENSGFNASPVRQAWQEHLSGKHDRQYEIWTILMFREWERRWN